MITAFRIDRDSFAIVLQDITKFKFSEEQTSIQNMIKEGVSHYTVSSEDDSTITKLKGKLEELNFSSLEAEGQKIVDISQQKDDSCILNLSEIIDISAFQTMMEDFNRITGIASAIVDINGNVLVSVGWQDICTRFHRRHPDTLKNCIQSDTILTRNIAPGTFKKYRCKNNLWDMATPIVVCGHHLGNFFIGQYLYADEKLDLEQFRMHARKYGFDEDEYFAALDKVPRFTREKADEIMSFYLKITRMILSLSYSTVQLTRTLDEHRKAEEALRESRDLLDSIERLVKVGGWEWDAVKETMTWTDETYRIHGMMPGEFAAGSPEHIQRSLACYDPEDRPVIEAAFRRCVEEAQPYNLEFPLTTTDGYRIWIQTMAKPVLENGRVVKVVGHIADITERKLAEEQIRLQSAITENISDSIIATDANFEITYANRKTEEMFGYSLEELRGKTPHIFNVEPMANEIQNEIYETVASGQIYSGESLNRRKDGSTFICEYKVMPLESEDGVAYAYVGIQRDITQLRHAQEKLIQAKEGAELASKTKSEFLANMSHELKTPLTAIIGFSELLNTRMFGELNEKQLGFVEYIIKNGNHLLELINNILDLSKIEAGRMYLDREIFCLSYLIEEVLATMYPLAAKKKIDIETVDEVKNDRVFADRTKLKQIMFNLLSNAIKFTPEAGKVSVIIKQDDGGIVISVSDTGIGIPLNMQENIFDLFTQVDGSIKRKYDGTGLGLAIVKQYVEMHNGKVWVESEEDKGSTFTFTIDTKRNQEK
ncbi:PAS/PAC sensor signal transduction histidine kinase [Methanosalsum zhilinae DSM 4017]|uniref:histidine kinase n=1 Tax=Methanosalsum zhilinae (strain DSM 4017 / NBRC 107636 / OCM 62 / WeN5) TaxID=679901 RepID=F7XNT5_METZD|nr:PocR ligand-binding domain-containing protein [Methanosalsum zhilinae]AEH61289.1 PAS/PAC sensor signal transduction histidine kinase [Methanosalsum zhilinae DSM 4017]